MGDARGQLPQGLAIQARRYEDAPPGLPPRCVVLSTSERKLLACPRRYFLAAIEALRSRRARVPVAYGVQWHRAKEPVYRAWLEDRPARRAELEESVALVRDALVAAMNRGELAPEEVVDVADRLQDNLDAWLHVTGGQPPRDYRLVGYELPLAMPVLGPGGRPYAPEMLVVEEGGGYRLARPGEAESAITVRWPF